MPHKILSREQAHTQGLKRFYTGEPCAKHGHTCERFVANGGCVMCQNWGSPKRKMQGPRGKNVGWPRVGLIFATPGVQLDEMEAAFRYIEAMRWHDYAVAALRKDPTLLEKYRTKLTPQEVGVLQAQLERATRSATPMQDALLTLACGFTQLYYGEPKRVGDSERCNDCRTDQRIIRVQV